MSEHAKAEAEKLWNTLRPATEALTQAVSHYYAALGSPRACRHINRLWQQDVPVIGLGFVPPEAKDRLEALIVQSGLHLHKGDGPLGRGVYFSLIHDAQLTIERLIRLMDAVAAETAPLKDAHPHILPKAAQVEMAMEEQVARVEGMHIGPTAGQLLHRPREVAQLADAFNGSVIEMKTAQALKLLASAIPYFNLPQECRDALVHTVVMMLDAE